MRIVIDTNVVASAIFFGGRPAALLRMVITRTLSAVATEEIVDEYQETVNYLMKKYSEKLDEFSLIPVVSAMEIIPASHNIHVCRDPDDDKFISCAVDGQCYYIVSGDKDLLTLGNYENIRILTVAEFMKMIEAE
jgi:putative PIN family toxin of toxin-antitoxin system